jgi:hypothetical protein
MDEKSYPKAVINRFMQSKFFFKDPLLKKYYEQNDVKKFRKRVHAKYSDEQFTNLVYVLVTDSLRDIILDTIGELTVFMKSMGDLIISGGEAFNMYMEFKDRIITSDIDAKFVPRIPMNAKYFGKLQAIKLIMWDKLGKIAKRLNLRVKKRIMSRKNPLYSFLGLGFKKKGPYVTRRYTLIKKKKTGDSNKPKKGDVFIDVELFALDLNIRYFSPKTGKIEDFVVGGILDIPYMRPKEFGYEVIQDVHPSISYRNMSTGNMKVNDDVMVAGKSFLIEDIYLMQKLNLRPEKKDKDRLRLFRLAKLFTKTVKSTDMMETLFKKVLPKITSRKRKISVIRRKPVLKRAIKIDPYKYEKFTSKPSKEKLSKQYVHGIKTTVPNTNVIGFKKTSGNQRFNLDSHLWKKNNSVEYIRNEFNMRPRNPLPLPNNINTQETLYGFKPRRDGWVPKPLLRRASEIPFVGLKN